MSGIRKKLHNSTSDEYAVIAPYYGLTRPPILRKSWHLEIDQPVTAIASTSDISETIVQQRIESAR